MNLSAGWKGASGQGWVAAQGVLDVLYRPLADALVDAIPPDARSVLDVGCGTGATTVAAATRLDAHTRGDQTPGDQTPSEQAPDDPAPSDRAPGARAVGVDISEPMIAAARARAERDGAAAEFVLADAARHPFEPGAFDAVISRFGVMFFDDPRAAFTHLRRACAEEAALRFLVWRGAAENPFMTAVEPAARALFPDLPDRPTSGPGPFRYADPDELLDVLRASGWTGADARRLDVECRMPASGLGDYLTRIGPLGLALGDADDETRARALRAVRPAFDPFVHDDEVRLPAACWLIVA